MGNFFQSVNHARSIDTHQCYPGDQGLNDMTLNSELTKPYPFTASMFLTAFVVVGTISLIASYLFKSHSKSSTLSSHSSETITPLFTSPPTKPRDRFPYQFETPSEQLFLELATQSESPLSEVPYPIHTAVSSETDWHANYLGWTKDTNPFLNRKREVEREFIVAQFPLNIEHLWKAAFDHSTLIIDFLNEEDMNVLRNRRVNKFFPLPNHHNQVFDSLIAMPQRSTLVKELPNTQCYQYEILLRKESIGNRTLSRIHYNNWTDFRVALPRVKELIELVNIINQYKEKDESHSTVILLCPTGNGQSALLASLWFVNELIKENQIIDENSLDKALRKLIPSLRSQRGNTFIEDDRQLELLRQCSYRLLKKHLKRLSRSFLFQSPPEFSADTSDQSDHL